MATIEEVYMILGQKLVTEMDLRNEILRLQTRVSELQETLDAIEQAATEVPVKGKGKK